MRRGTIQLSAQFLVTLILTLVVLGVGFGIFYNVLDKSTELGNEVTKETQQRIDQLLLQGDLAITPSIVRIEGGETGSAAIGIQNTLPQDTEFIIKVENGIGETSKSQAPTVQYLKTLSLTQDARGITRININAKGSTPGQYAYKVIVHTGNPEDPYTGRTPLLIVRVR